MPDHRFKPCFYLKNAAARQSCEALRLCLCPAGMWRCHREGCGKTAAEHGIKKCDGNHAGPRCLDPECWND